MPDPKRKAVLLKKLKIQARALECEAGKSAVFAEGIKTEFWRKIKEKFKNQLEAVETNLDNYKGLTDVQIRDLLAERHWCRGFVGIEDYAKARAYFDSKLRVVEEKIREVEGE